MLSLSHMLGDFVVRLIADWLVAAVVIAGVAGMLFGVPSKVRYQAYARGFIAGLTALLLAKVASLLYQGERPFVELGVPAKAAYLDNPGFPSDHVLFVFTITCVVWASTKNKTLGLWLLGMSILVGIGRMVALVHTPLDVAGGVACAGVAAILWYGRNLLPARAKR